MNTRGMIEIANLLVLNNMDAISENRFTTVDEMGRGSDAMIFSGEGTQDDPIMVEDNLLSFEDRTDSEHLNAASKVESKDYIQEMFNLVHNARTKRVLDQMFPNNKIPLKYLQELADTCPECQMEHQSTNQHLSGMY